MPNCIGYFNIEMKVIIYYIVRRKNGKFTIHNVKPGSYVLEVYSTKLDFKSLAIDVSRSGKVRARKYDSKLPDKIALVPYPIHIKPRRISKYFETREDFTMQDIIFNPMVIYN